MKLKRPWLFAAALMANAPLHAEDLLAIYNLALRQDPAHSEELARIGAVPIDIVVANAATTVREPVLLHAQHDHGMPPPPLGRVHGHQQNRRTTLRGIDIRDQRHSL